MYLAVALLSFTILIYYNFFLAPNNDIDYFESTSARDFESARLDHDLHSTQWEPYTKIVAGSRGFYVFENVYVKNRILFKNFKPRLQAAESSFIGISLALTRTTDFSF